jgi:hypothetical protein
MKSVDQVLMEQYGIKELKELDKLDEWEEAMQEDADRLADLDDVIDLSEEALVEGLTDREKTFLFSKIHRMFGECAKRCGRITVFSKANACKDMCIAKKDQAEKAARRRTKATIAKEKGKTKKAKKFEKKAKEIEKY